MIVFQEEQTTGYRNRTIKNASADATIAFAINFESAGERLTKASVLSQNKKYIGLNMNQYDQIDDELKREIVLYIVKKLNEVNAKTLNIAGNGIYTLKGRYTQQQVDDFTHQILKDVIEHKELKNKIIHIRTGGQTGFDEAGTKASIRLGIDTLVLAPKNWKFRNEKGQDISDEIEFKKRFK